MKPDDPSVEQPLARYEGGVLDDDALRRLARRIQHEGDIALAAQLRSLLIQLRTIEVIDLWEPREAAITYWILLLSGVGHADEMELARDLLSWQTFSAKDSARVLCVQSSDRDMFRCCATHFRAHSFPALFISDTPHMDSYIKIDSELLRTMATTSGDVQRFLTKVHALVEHGRSLGEIRERILARVFWRGIGIVYKELKGLVSIKITPS